MHRRRLNILNSQNLCGEPRKHQGQVCSSTCFHHVLGSSRTLAPGTSPACRTRLVLARWHCGVMLRAARCRTPSEANVAALAGLPAPPPQRMSGMPQDLECCWRPCLLCVAPSRALDPPGPCTWVQIARTAQGLDCLPSATERGSAAARCRIHYRESQLVRCLAHIALAPARHLHNSSTLETWQSRGLVLARTCPFQHLHVCKRQVLGCLASKRSRASPGKRTWVRS